MRPPKPLLDEEQPIFDAVRPVLEQYAPAGERAVQSHDPASFPYDDMRRDLTAALTLSFAASARISLTRLLNDHADQLDTLDDRAALVETLTGRAGELAEGERTTALVAGLLDTTRTLLEQAWTEYHTKGWSDTLKRGFSAQRATTIAQTEATQLFGGLINAFARAVGGALGVPDTIFTWKTADDEKVCPLCAPLDGKEVGRLSLGQTPQQTDPSVPRHPNCRCRIVVTFA